MILDAIIDDQVYSLNIPETLLSDAGGFFDQLDQDMAKGWQMSRDWVANPDPVQRGQIVADKLLTALETENQKLGLLMAAYLLSRMPGLKGVELDTRGEIQNNRFLFHSPATTAAAPTDEAAASARLVETACDRTGAPRGLGKLDALAQAGQDVTQVFRVGKGYRFSVFDHATQSWQDAPLLKSAEEAEHLRQRIFTDRYHALQRED